MSMKKDLFISMKNLTFLKIRILNGEKSSLRIGCDTTMYTIPPFSNMDCTLLTTKKDLIDLKNQLIKIRLRGKDLTIIINPTGFNDGSTKKHS